MSWPATVEIDGEIFLGSYSELTWESRGKHDLNDDARVLFLLSEDAPVFVEASDWARVQANLGSCPYPSAKPKHPAFDFGRAA